MALIKLTQVISPLDDYTDWKYKTVWINPDAVTRIGGVDSGLSYIRTIDGGDLYVKGDLDDIANDLNLNVGQK